LIQTVRGFGYRFAVPARDGNGQAAVQVATPAGHP
jgi:hypothetical protein